MKHGGARSYLEALGEYEEANQQAIALARDNHSNAAMGHGPRDLDLDVGPDAEAVRAVMLRWHLAMMAVLETGQQMFQHTVELTTADKAEDI